MPAIQSSAITYVADRDIGAACIRDTRVGVWLLVRMRELGESDETILRAIPHLTRDDLTAAWDHNAAHPDEIQEAIAANEADDPLE